MFVDASALTAMITGEDDAAVLLARLQQGRRRITSPLAVWEAGIAVARLLNISVGQSSREVHDFLLEVEIELIDVAAETTVAALDAFDRFDKGRHPARLNMGDCFAYACARHYRQPLLYKGGDFALTDIESA